MNGSIFAIEARGSGAHRAPLSRAAQIRRFAAGVVITAMAMLGLQASPAWAAAAGDISKALDATQGPGFSGTNTFQTGSLVRYRIVVSCSSLDTACVTGTVTDVLDPNLQFVQVIAPVAKNNDGQTLPITTTVSGQTVTTVVGSAAAPFQGGNTLELVLVARVVSKPASGIIPNQASITVPGVAPVNSEIVNIQVPPPTPNYRMTKAVVGAATDAALGEPVTYQVSLEGYQFGNVSLVVPITITDTYPAGATVINAGGGTVDAANHTITWTVTSVNQVTSPTSGQCQYTYWCSAWSALITLSYPSGTFSAGQTTVNTISSDPTYVSGDLPPLTASASKRLASAAPAVTAAKSGPPQASAGNTITYRISGTNAGNTALTNFTVTDTIPTGVTNYQIVRSAYYMPIGPPSLGPVTYEALVGGVWTTIGGYSTTGVSTPSTTFPLPAGATAWRMSVASIPAGGSLNIDASATIPADAADGTVYTNCAVTSTSTTGTTVGPSSCVNTTVVEPFVGLTPFKAHVFNDPAQTSVVPGETFLWGLGVKPTGPNPLTSLDYADQLPAQFEYVTTRCFGAYGEGNGLQNSINGVANGTPYVGPGCNNAGVPQPTTNVVNADGSTSLTWQDVPISAGGQPSVLWAGGDGNIWWIIIEVRVKPGTAVANYTNQMAVGTGGTSLATTCAGDTGGLPNPDSTDWDKDGNVTEELCRSDDPVQVRLAAAADTTKWDKGPLPNALLSTGTIDPSCPDWDGFTRYPCVAQTNPGGAFDYRFNIQNTGNMTLTNYVGYDILPYVGDTGVNQILSAQPRLTEWTPVLTGPVEILSQPAAAGTQILYNLTTNPCRPELAQGGVDATWQATCDDTWYTAAQISDWSTVKSFKILAFQDGAVWNAAEQIILNAPMLAPLNAPDSTKDPLDLSIAWNSIAHREFSINPNNNNSVDRLLAAEPLKVGIIVPFKGVSVGDYVWYDANRDGLQSPNEDPIADVLVQLKDASGNIVQETTTNADGYYSFQYLTPGAQYTIVFTAPADPADATKLLLFTEANASGVTSNDPTADNGTVPLDGTTGGDSDAIAAADGLTGSVTFTAPLSGSNAISDKTAGTTADNPGLDAGFVPSSVPVSIGDYVWLDNNRDGLQTAGEPGVAGVTVTLKDSTGTVVGTPYVTLADGYYWFTGLTSGASYTLTFTQPSGYSWTTQNVTGVTDNNLTTDNLDSDVNPTDGTIAFTAPATGTNAPGAPNLTDNPTLDGGLVRLNLQLQKSGGTWTGLLVPGTEVTWTLTPNNAGPSDSLAGWKVTDLIPSGLQIVSMGGTNYTCDITTAPTAPSCTSSVPLLAGTTAAPITVVTKVAAGWTGSSFHNVAYISPATGEAPETNPLVTPTTSTITSNSTTDNDAEASLNVVSVGDYVWVDTNRNGLQDSGEAPVVGATVTLYAADGTTVLGTTTTNASGYYWFTGLSPSTAYVIGFDISTATSPAGATAFFTTPNAGGVTSNSATADLTDSDAVPATATAQQATVSFTSQATGSNLGAANVADNPGIDAGIVVYNLKLAKTLDTAGPYVPGMTVTYTLIPSNDGPADALAGWSVTDLLPTGLTFVSMTGDATKYSCSANVCTSLVPLAKGPGAPITVTATIDATFTGSANNVAYVAPSSTDGPETVPLGTPVTKDGNTDGGTDNDAQAPLEIKKVSVGDYVWVDANRNGVQDAGEAPVVGATVTLYAADGTTVIGTPVLTDATGHYWFTDLLPGTAYVIGFDISTATSPAGATAFFTTPNAGGVTSNSATADLTDSDAVPATATAQQATVSFTSQASGNNLGAADVADNPGIDAGIVVYNLKLAKALTSIAPFVPGQTVTYTLTPHNDGPAAALAGWSVTDILPADLTLVSMSGGAGYTCTGNTCVAVAPLAAGTDGPVITVTATLSSTFSGVAKNVAYVSPAGTDGPETNALVTPTLATDTTTSGTDNDAQATLEVKKVSVGDYVWVDANRNGVQDAGEAPVVGATVTLYAADGTTVIGTPVLTDATGHYWFTDLLPGTAYVIGFDISTATSPAGATAFFTTPNAGGVTSNSATADLTDSDAVPATATAQQATVSFTSQATGNNLGAADVADNPGIDAGIVVYNLKLAKTLDTTAPYYPGQTVTYTLTPSNDGPADALAGWSVTDLLPTGLTFVSMAGDATKYSCSANVCTSLVPLAAGTSGAPITVIANIDAGFTGSANNVAYVAPSSTDGPETVPLGTPVTKDGNTDGGTDNDAQAPLEVKKVSIGDYVWWDINRDGLQGDPAVEPPIAGMTVNLLDAAGNPVLVGGVPVTTVTSVDGYYAFTDLVPNTAYTVVFVKSSLADTANASFTILGGGDLALDSNANPADGTAPVVTPTGGNNLGDPTLADNPTIDAGLVKYNLTLAKTLVTAGPYYPGLTVTYTLIPSNDGPADALAGWSVTDVLPTGMTFVSMTGDSSAYTCAANVCTSLVALPKGAGAPITVTATIDAGFIGTANNVAYVAPSGTDVPETNPLGEPVVKDGDTDATPTDNDDQQSLEVLPVSIGDYVWYDRNRDGQQGAPADEPVVPGVVVNLLDAAGNPVLVGGVAVTTVTDANGYYAFTDLAPHTAYIVEFVKPANTVFTTPLTGDTATDSNADVVTGQATVTTKDTGSNSAEPGMADDPTIDAGLIELVSIGDYVWYDRNRDGLQGAVADEPVVAGVTVNLLDAEGNPAVLPGGAPVTTVTDANGFYSFTNLLAGVTYVVEFVKPADTIFTTPDVSANAADTTDSDADEVTGKVTVVAPVTGDNSATTPDNPTIDAGLIELVSIGDYVWWDTNRDGLQTEGELPVPGVTVNLLDVDGNPAVLPGGAPVTTVTDANGFYSFNNLIGGVDYVVQFVKPDNTTFTWMLEGDDSTVDSDADLDGLVPVTAPVSGNNSLETPDDPTFDAGLVKLVSVGDYVWYDVNRDGIQDEGEAPVPGVTVNLYDDETGELLATVVTDENGFYSFTDLWAGATYTIEFVKPAGTSFTSMDSGSDDALDSDADLTTGMVTFVAPADGSNSAVTPDDPTIDAGLVKFNLTLTKVLSTTGVIYPGDTVTFTLTPHNDGPVDTLAGWSVTEVVPAGLTFVSMTGDGYTCTGTTCVAEGSLAAGADGNPITVTMTAGQSASSRNIAFIDKAPTEGPETNPLVTPTQDTDTTTSETDNDSEAAVIVSPVLPDTGTDVAPFLALALGLMAAGGLLLAATRRRRRPTEQ